MKLVEIFTPNDKVTSEARMEALLAIVVKAKAAYGNTDTDISVGEMHTSEGLQDMAMLSIDDKLAIAAHEFRNIKTAAVEFTKSFEGAILDKKIEELLAISPIMSNLGATIDSAYL